MKKKIFLIAFIFVAFIASLYASAGIVASRLEYKFLGFEQILKSVINKEAISFNIEINSPSLMGISIKNLDVVIFNSSGKEVLSFIPFDLKIKQGKNFVTTTFKEGRTNELLGDFLNNSYKTYKVKVKGLIFGFLPFSYKTDLIAE